MLLDNRKEQINLVNKNSRNFLYDEENHISQFGKECRAFLKIQDGCNNFCSYCIIPYVRGNSRSRKKAIFLYSSKLFAAEHPMINTFALGNFFINECNL